MAATTTKLLLAVPSAALGVNVTPSASAWVWSSWVEIEDVAPTPMVLQGYSLNGSAWTNADFEIEFGVGVAGAEVTVARHRATMSTAANHNSFTLPVPMNVVNTGDRVAVRVRASVGNTTAVRVALSYYDGSTFDSTNVTKNILEVYPATGANGVSLTPSTTTWGNSAYAQLVASTTDAIYLTGLQFVPAGTSGVSFEIDLATGASGSETVIHTIRGRYDTAAGWIQNTFPMPVPVPAGTRLSTRIRKGNAVTTAWRVSAPYMLQSQRFTPQHTTSTFLFSYKQFKNHTTDVFKTSTTTTQTQNFRNTASSDDAMEAAGGGATTSLTDTQVVIKGANNVGYRIPNITIPQGTQITSAILSFTNLSGSFSNSNGYGGTVILKAEDTTNAATFAASTGNIHNRARSADTVTLPDPSNYAAQPPNVTQLVQVILNKAGWVSGNAMAFLWLGDGSADTRSNTVNTVDNTFSYGQGNLAITTTVVNARSMARRHTADTFKRTQTLATYTRTHTTSVSKKTLVVGTKTHTSDVFKRFAYFRSHTTSSNLRKATVKSHTTNVFARDSRSYSRQDLSTLPSNNTDLAIPFSQADYGTVAADDSTYVDLAGSNFLTFQFKKEADSTTNAVTVIWNGKSTIAPSTRAAYLQIYNRTSGAWETIDSNTVAAANTDFTMTGSKTTNLTNYYDANKIVTARVYQ